MKSKRHPLQVWLTATSLLLTSATICIQAAPMRTRRTPIPFDQIGTTANRQAVSKNLFLFPSTDGASIRCTFQKLEGRVNSNGLWLSSTTGASNGTPCRIIAQSFGREDSV